MGGGERRWAVNDVVERRMRPLTEFRVRGGGQGFPLVKFKLEHAPFRLLFRNKHTEIVRVRINLEHRQYNNSYFTYNNKNITKYF